MRLQPVENLVCELVFDSFAGHARLVDKEFEDKDLCEAGLKLVVDVIGGRCVFSELNLGAPRRSTIGGRRLVSVSNVEAEHQLVTDLVQEGNVGAEFNIVD